MANPYYHGNPSSNFQVPQTNGPSNPLHYKDMQHPSSEQHHQVQYNPQQQFNSGQQMNVPTPNHMYSQVPPTSDYGHGVNGYSPNNMMKTSPQPHNIPTHPMNANTNFTPYKSQNAIPGIRPPSSIPSDEMHHPPPSPVRYPPQNQGIIQSHPPISRFSAPPPVSNFNTPPPVSNFNAPPSLSNFNAPPSVSSFNAPPPVSSMSAPPRVSNFNAPQPTYPSVMNQSMLLSAAPGAYPNPQLHNPTPYQPASGTNQMMPPTLLPGQQQQHAFATQPPMQRQGVQPPPPMVSGPQPVDYHQPPNADRPPGPPQLGYLPTSGITNGMKNMGFEDAFKPVDLMQETCLISAKKHRQKPLRFEDSSGDRGLVPPKRKNCNTDVFRCTLNAIPSTQALLNKVKLPLGLIIHPFKDLSSLPVISAGTIVRCKRCRTYINPFVNFLDERRWRCNLCFVVNDVPEEFLHHPVTKTYGLPHTRPECTNATLEFVAPQEYMVRPPQPAVYLFLFDVSHAAIESGYLQIVCDALLDHLDHLPGDSRTKIGFLTYNGTVHFYRMEEGLSQPQMLVVSDIEDIFSPTPDCLLANLRERKELICDLLRQLPEIHSPPDNLSRGEVESQSALGAALQIAYKLMSPFGGRVTVFQQTMPSVGPGMLKPRENPNSRAGDTSTESLNPSTDFYKKLALECSANQIAVDFFFLNSQFVDIATLSCTSRFSAGDMHYYPGFHITHNPMQVERLTRDLDRYLTRKIGFESVMRIRCTRGIAIHTFHGNFFVRSTDLLALANINPDAGFGLNLSIEESLADMSQISIQAAVLYTSSKGERRIRVHTMCFPIAKSIIEVFNNVDSDAVTAILIKMAVDRSVTASLPDARDALRNAVIDPLKVYKDIVMPGVTDSSLLVPPCMKTFPLMINCLLKHPAFRSGISTRLDDRVFAMIDLKMQPAGYAIQTVHPDLYRVDNLTDEGGLDIDERIIPQPHLLPLSAASVYRDGVYLLDVGWRMYLYVGALASREFLSNVLGVKQFSNIEEPMLSLPDLDNPQAESFNNFVEWLQDQRPHHAPLQVVREDSRERYNFMLLMRQDKTESSMSLQEFLQHVKQQMSRSK